MKGKIFTLIIGFFTMLTYAQEASDFGPADVLICDFEGVNQTVVDSLWTDTTETTPVTEMSGNITVESNPFSLENVSDSAALYVRPEGQYKSIFIRFDESITFARNPYLQVQIYPVSGHSPTSTKVSISVRNDEGEVAPGGGTVENIPQDQWTTVTAFVGRLKSSDSYNTIEILINADDSLSVLGGTQYYIDQIGFKAEDDLTIIPSTIFYEDFGVYNDDWEKGLVNGQLMTITGTDTIGPNEVGYVETYASIGGFSSDIPFKYFDAVGDTAIPILVRTWGMMATYESPSGNGRVEFQDYREGVLETGSIDVSGYNKFMLSFGFGTQQFWAYQDEIGNTRPLVEISVDSSDFYEVTSESDFMLFLEIVDLGWGDINKYEDEFFKLVEYPLTTETGAVIDSAETINIRISHKTGKSFFIDDVWFSARVIGQDTVIVIDPVENVEDQSSSANAQNLNIYPNPASEYIYLKDAQNVMITDIHGRLVLESMYNDYINIEKLSSGIYFVRAQVNNKLMTGKFIKR